MHRYFVTGTDTGAGKTFVTAALARRARDLGNKVFAFKPIETGCEVVEGRRVGHDQETISIAAGDWQQGPQRALYQFLPPVAPLVAAKAEGTEIELARIVEVANSVPSIDVLLVEGAGGWRVPITETEDMASLARRVLVPSGPARPHGAHGGVVIVARAGLGTINHSLLTVEAVERDGLTIAALVLSRRPDEDLEFAASNREQIARRWGGQILVLDTDLSVLDPLLRTTA